jgi:replicative DNA helicase
MPSTNAEQSSQRSHQSAPTEDFRIPFSALDEAAVLGNLMLDFERMAVCRRMNLTSSDFFIDGHRIIYSTMMANQEAHVEQFDPVSIVRYLKASGELDRAGGPARIASLTDGITRFYADSVFEGHIRAVKEFSRRRLLMRQANHALNEIADGERGAGEIARDLQRLAEEVQVGDTQPPTTTSHLAVSARQRLADRIEAPPRGTRSGFDDLDSIINRLLPGHLCVLAARPRVGKSTLALQWAMQAIQDGFSPLLLSFEMSAEEITDRLLMLRGRIHGGRFHSGLLSQDEWERFSRAQDFLSQSGLQIRDRVSAVLPAVAAEIRVAQQKMGVDLVVVDYLGLMSGRGENRVADLSEITRGLKLLARDCEVPILCLAQLNRAIEARGNDKPRLSDLRESGSIEQDADQVIFITRDLDSETDCVDATIIVEKNRHGRTGKAKIGFDRRIGGFVQ